jgi:hypothetical protein
MRQYLKNLNTAAKTRLFQALGLCALAVTPALSADVTIPTTGIDVAGYVTAAITALGGVVAVVIGGFFAWLIIKKAVGWAGRALG